MKDIGERIVNLGHNMDFGAFHCQFMCSVTIQTAGGAVSIHTAQMYLFNQENIPTNFLVFHEWFSIQNYIHYK